jgi:hypothetical protein
MLAHGQSEALHKGRDDLPTMGRSHLVDWLARAGHDTVCDADATPPAHRLDDPCVAPLWQGEPPGLGSWAFALAALWLPPVPSVRQQGGHGLSEAIRQQQRGAVRGSHLGYLRHQVLRHGQRTIANIDGQKQLGYGVHGHADPMGRAIKALHGLGLADLIGLHSAGQGKEYVELDLRDPHVVEEIRGEGCPMLRYLDQSSERYGR